MCGEWQVPSSSLWKSEVIVKQRAQATLIPRTMTESSIHTMRSALLTIATSGHLHSYGFVCVSVVSMPTRLPSSVNRKSLEERTVAMDTLVPRSWFLISVLGCQASSVSRGMRLLIFLSNEGNQGFLGKLVIQEMHEMSWKHLLGPEMLWNYK